MCQNDSNIKTKQFKQITLEDRLLIEHLSNKQNKNITEIAEEIGKNKGSISREIKIGLVKLLNSDLSYRIEYSAYVAQKKRDYNSSAKGANLKIGKDIELSKYIDAEIKNKISPEVIAEKIKNNESFNTKICYKTIYNYIDDGVLISSRKDLICGKYRSSKKKYKIEKAITTQSKEGRRITDRPKEVESRNEVGHWEMDLVEGTKNNKGKVLLVLSDRMFRREIIELLPNKKQESVINALNRIERRFSVKGFREEFKSITTDNGREFLDFKGIEKSYTGSKIKRTSQYFATAYCSWQRGTNENINKMIRRFLPKGTSFDNLTNKEVKEIEKYINTYPRKMFKFKSAKEMHETYIKSQKQIA